MSYWYAYFADGSTCLIRARSGTQAMARAHDAGLYPFVVLFKRKEWMS